MGTFSYLLSLRSLRKLLSWTLRSNLKDFALSSCASLLIVCVLANIERMLIYLNCNWEFVYFPFHFLKILPHVYFKKCFLFLWGTYISNLKSRVSKARPSQGCGEDPSLLVLIAPGGPRKTAQVLWVFRVLSHLSFRDSDGRILGFVFISVYTKFSMVCNSRHLFFPFFFLLFVSSLATSSTNHESEEEEVGISFLIPQN